MRRDAFSPDADTVAASVGRGFVIAAVNANGHNASAGKAGRSIVGIGEVLDGEIHNLT
jgi:hypothetical protein